jgi:16S rRNA (adenine1518-N6/adenine1519-N6)-dimethyltransferase
VHDSISTALQKRGCRSKLPATRRPRKSLGQHFLRDRRIVHRIVDAADIQPDDIIVEIGPGRGALTKTIVESASNVILIEFDADLAADLTERYADDPSVRVTHADARTLSTADVPEIGDRPYKVIGNLPYYAAAPIVRNLLEQAHQPELLVVMLQREVAREMSAQPGKMGLLSVATQLYAEPRTVCQAPPRAFNPPPKVHSTVIKLEVRDRPAVEFESVDSFFTLARAGFAAPRKTLAGSLAVGFRKKPSDFTGLIQQADLDPRQRPATLSMDDWGALYAQWHATESAA